MAQRQKREYLILLEKAKGAVETAVDSYNRVKHPYRNETALILLTKAWELLAKAILVQAHQSITKGQRGDTVFPVDLVVQGIETEALLCLRFRV